MVQSFLIVFRETLEAALIVGIVLGYLARTRQERYRSTAYLALAAGIGASVLAAVLFQLLAGGFSGKAEQIFEGATMLAGAALLTTMILWLMGRADAAARLEQRLEEELSHSQGISRGVGVFLLVFLSVLREGVETVIFLGAARFTSSNNNLLGALIGLVAAVLLGFGLFRGALKIRLRSFFAVTNVLLILFAAGLVAQGVHELQEAGLIPTVVEHLWDINPPVTGDRLPVLHENGALGGIAKGLFGYNGNPSLFEVLGYGLYLLAVILLWLRVGRTRRTHSGVKA